MVTFQKVWSWNEFEKFIVFSTIRLKGAKNFFMREILEVFYFSSTFIVVKWKAFKKDFWEILVLSKYFQSLRIKFIISLYISFWLANVLEEVTLGCRNIQSGKFVRNIPEWDAIEIQVIGATVPLLKKWRFSLRISSVNVTKSSFLRIWSHSLKKSLMQNFIFCADSRINAGKLLLVKCSQPLSNWIKKSSLFCFCKLLYLLDLKICFYLKRARSWLEVRVKFSRYSMKSFQRALVGFNNFWIHFIFIKFNWVSV